MMEKIKENGALIGVIVFVLIIVIFIFTSESNSKVSDVEKNNESIPVVIEKEVSPNTFVGSFKTGVKADQSLNYSFLLPANAKTVAEEGGAFIVATLDDKPFAKVYFRDQTFSTTTPAAYLNKVVAPQVKEFSLSSKVLFGDFSWQKGESVTMEWHVTEMLDGKLLAFVESYKKDHDEVANLLGSMKVSLETSNSIVASTTQILQ